MRTMRFILVGTFGAILLSWLVIVLGSHRQLKTLAPHFDALENASYPAPLPGAALQGQNVYRELGCGACHTQQVTRSAQGLDQRRGWGDRPSFARDYVLQTQPQFGQMRIGPDLTNFGERAPKASQDRPRLHALLYKGQGGMPAYAFLFERREISGQRSATALAASAPSGTQLVPTARAEALVSYLLSLKQDYPLPEATPGGTASRATDPVFAGKKRYAAACAICHQPSGLGTPGTYPPLAGSEWVTGSEERLIRIVLHGLSGEVDVGGARYNGTMPSFGNVPGSGYNWSDAQIAAVLTYIRQEWGNKAPPIAQEKVSEIRSRFTRATPWTAAELTQ